MGDTLATAYLNGSFLPIEAARISPLDRGFLFGDAVYEVIPVYGGKPVLLEAHLQRLDHSLKKLRIPNPHLDTGWRAIVTGLVEKNGGGNLAIYVQVSRGADTGRDHRFPNQVAPTVFGLAARLGQIDLDDAGVKAITAPDERWARCDIKSTALLANVLARQAAEDAGAVDAILLRDGYVTEAGASSVLIVEQGTLVRRPNGPEILPGTTNRLVLELAGQAGLDCREEPVSEERLRNADEIWLTSATRGIAPVTVLDGQPVGDGSPGPVWRKIANLYAAYIHA
jgi:D-alanine transaminase